MASCNPKSSRPTVSTSRRVDVTQFQVYDASADYFLKRASVEAKLTAIKQNLQRNESFVDESFPNFYAETRDNQQLIEAATRPKDLGAQYHNPFDPWVIFKEENVNDINQGELADCWLVAAIANIGAKTDILSKLFVSDKYTSKGVYGLLLFHDGEWQEVIIDDRFLCTLGGQPACAHTRSKQLWVPLLEKAVAKLLGSYSKLEGGHPSNGFRILTTSFSLILKIKQKKCTVNEQKRKFAQKHIYSALRKNFLVCTSTFEPKEDELPYGLVGLYPNHVYTVHDTIRVTRVRLILLRNVWGNTIWTGDWSPKSRLWQAVPYEDLPCQGKGNEAHGTFWMNMPDFFKYYTAVYFCNANIDSYLYSLRSVMICSLDSQWGVLQFTVKEECSVDIGLVFVSSTAPNSKGLNAMIALFDEHGILIASSNMVIFTRYQAYITSQLLPPGKYKAYCISFDSWIDQSTTEFCFVLHSTKRVKCKLVTEPIWNFAPVLLRMTHDVGKPYFQDEVQVYELKPLILHGTMVVAVNYSSDKTFSVNTNLELPLGNMRTTRYENSTVDTIPPLHSQILQVVSAENALKQYRIQLNISYYTSPFSIERPIDIKNIPEVPHQNLPLHRLLPNDEYMGI